MAKIRERNERKKYWKKKEKRKCRLFGSDRETWKHLRESVESGGEGKVVGKKQFAGRSN